MPNNLLLALLIIGVLIVGGAIAFLTLQPDAQPPDSPTTITTEQAVENAIRNTLARDKNGNPVVSPQRIYLLTTPEEFRYQITYQEPQNLFSVDILDWRFQEARLEGEQKLLRLTELSETDACELLNVQISTPSFVNPELAGQVFPLSFCQ